MLICHRAHIAEKLWNGFRKTINGSAGVVICLLLQGIGPMYSVTWRMSLMTCLAASRSIIAISAAQNWIGTPNIIDGIVEDARCGNELKLND